MKDLHIDILIRSARYDELDEKQRQLVDKAKEATSRSYAPYSRFAVGAAVMLDDGTIVEGSNQENVAFPSGICAERTAIFYANSRYPGRKVCMLAIAARDETDFTEIPTPPCGACRQVLLETEQRYGQPISILLYGKKMIYLLEGVKSLLPLSFDGWN